MSFAVILVEPQLGENIGMCARAMWNCGLKDLRLVSPRDGWPSDSAVAAASGAMPPIDNARVFETTADAVADLDYVLATTARTRDMTKRVFTPETAVREMYQRGNCGVLFGKESRGLQNDDVALADAVLTVPLNPVYTSLNLAQAVFLVAYEWFKLQDETPPEVMTMPPHGRPATKKEMVGLFEHLEEALDDSGFLMLEDKRPTMVRNLRNMFGRADLTAQEVRTLRGIIRSLTDTPQGKRRK